MVVSRCTARVATAALLVPIVAADLFSTFDTNGDGKLSRIEFQGISTYLMKQMNQTFTPPSGEDVSALMGDKVLGFWPAFINSVMMIWATEIGDKTFFIAAIMAMRHDRLIVFSGAALALYVMTVLSAGLGYLLPNMMPRKYTHYAAAGLFLYFGAMLLKDGLGMEHGKASEELEEVEEELNTHKHDDTADAERGQVAQQRRADRMHRVFWQALTLTFIAEWGDRSQIATIALAAAKDPYGVTVGGCVGHSMCTGLAVIGGRMLSNRISERTVTLWGGVCFLCFAVHSFFFEM